MTGDNALDSENFYIAMDGGLQKNLWDYIVLQHQHQQHINQGNNSDKYQKSNPNDGIYFIFKDRRSTTQNEMANKKL